MPLRYPLAQLLGCLEELFPREGKGFVLIEYVMLKGVNDTAEDAQRLGALLRGIKCKVRPSERCNGTAMAGSHAFYTSVA